MHSSTKKPGHLSVFYHFTNLTVIISNDLSWELKYIPKAAVMYIR